MHGEETRHQGGGRPPEVKQRVTTVKCPKCSLFKKVPYGKGFAFHCCWCRTLVERLHVSHRPKTSGKAQKAVRLALCLQPADGSDAVKAFHVFGRFRKAGPDTSGEILVTNTSPL